jgi:glutathione S-transferase
VDVVCRLDAASGAPARHRTRTECLTIADRKLAGKEWALAAYSIADIHLFRLYWRLVNSLQFPPETFSNLCAHYHRLMQRPAVQKTIEIEMAIGYELPK